jgi:hypothetical protein
MPNKSSKNVIWATPLALFCTGPEFKEKKKTTYVYIILDWHVYKKQLNTNRLLRGYALKISKAYFKVSFLDKILLWSYKNIRNIPTIYKIKVLLISLKPNTLL